MLSVNLLSERKKCYLQYLSCMTVKLECLTGNDVSSMAGICQLVHYYWK